MPKPQKYSAQAPTLGIGLGLGFGLGLGLSLGPRLPLGKLTRCGIGFSA